MGFDYRTCLLRLTDLERQKLQLVVAAFKVSEYTDDVDDHRRFHSRNEKMLESMRQIFDTIVGLAIASDAIPRSTKEALVADETDVSSVAPLLEELIEIFRRHKRLNPYANRTEYGKLVMFLQDIQSPSVKRRLGLNNNLLLPLQTVGSSLERIDCLQILSDNELRTKFLRPSGPEKQKGLETLVDRYAGDDQAKREVVERCLRSADDVRQFILSNVRPLESLISIVKNEYAAMSPSDSFNISIRQGVGGSCVTRGHELHVRYVLESLSLWSNVQHKIFSVWEAAEIDMLEEGKGDYSMVDTGQGFHRMCSAPRSYNVMSGLVRDTERAMGGWVGIKVIHLGDRDVPNPLVFIDKYTVIPKIITPIVQVLEELKRVFSEEGGASSPYPGLRNFLRSKYHNYEKLRLTILTDFFKHGFDGSGDDGGNCIDGRLTSAWNWCHQLEKKNYYDAFVLTGFTGFD